MNRTRKINMKEHIVKFERGPRKKKYTVHVQNKKTKKTRKLHFGARGYAQYRDSTPLKLYKKHNHNDRRRMMRYFSRHSGTSHRSKAIQKEIRKSKGLYTPKLLSHLYLW